MDKAAPDEQVVFMLDAERGMLVLGVPTAAWDYMKSGKTHLFDLTRVGFPVKIVMFGGPSRAHILDMMQVLQGGGELPQLSGEDWKIPEDEQAVPRMRAAARGWLMDKRDMLNVSDADIDRLLESILRQEVGPKQEG